ncbi:unnamed protein product [Gongylonema pulchrum]|uniref:RNA-directed DNA polymerase n=1 Tax=Gongylonema pulchrum TaxID=637853 RepID=A0A183DRG1_9BILA|nr:unnamed protein product [Gongylonema pulchrum]
MIDADTFQRILDAQRKQQEELAGQLCEKLTVISLDEQSTRKLEPIIDTVQNSIPKFVYFSDSVDSSSKKDQWQNTCMCRLLNELNEALELHQCLLPFLEDIFAALTGGRCFTHSDFADAYLQVQVDEVPHPVNANQLRSFLEMVNHYDKFVKSLHEIRAPLDQLLPKDVKLNWTVRCEQAFKEIKNVLRSDMLLTQCDPKVDVVIAAGASNYGLGAVFSHEFLDGREKAIAHASRTLTTSERKYSQIEKEASGLRNFHKMILIGDSRY